MADGQSTSRGSVISTPSGGGAVRGIGERFAPDLHTGTGNFAIPLQLPDGRHGHQPDLTLGYSSGSGNGPFGLGWSLGVPGVSRSTAKGIPRYDDANDLFLLSGSEELVPVEHRKGWTRYQPRTEGLFARIIHHRDPTNDYWSVATRDGLTSTYGTPGTSGADPAAVADPARARNVFAWALTRTVDVFGNVVDYDYLRDTGTPERPWAQLYLSRVRYIDVPTATHGATHFLVSVAFDYGVTGDERPDPFSDYRAGFEIRTRWRCGRIAVSTHADVDRLLRTYDLTYVDERAQKGDVAGGSAPTNRLSLLSLVRMVGHDGATTEVMPALELRYTEFDVARRSLQPLSGELPRQSLSTPTLELVDLFGSGLPDVLEMNGVVRYWRNLGSGTFDVPRFMERAPAGVELGAPGVQLIDADGDGRTDLLVNTPTLAGYFSLRHDGGWDDRGFHRYRQAPSFDLRDPEVHLVDLDGDGATDAIRSGARFECFFNDREDGWREAVQVSRRALADFPDVSFADPRVHWADMSGDGQQDIVLVYDGNVEYWPNLGRGRWGRRLHMERSPRLPFGYDPKRVLVGDIDGDGAADLLYVADDHVTLWINQSGNSWSDPIEIAGTPGIALEQSVRLVDLCGAGVAGVLWSADAGTASSRQAYFLDLSGGQKPYLLAELDNHMGAVTRVRYAPSTRFYLDDLRSPTTRWKSSLPMPVQVVASVQIIDAISLGKVSTEYRYRHGYWDGAEREFRGFGMVEQRDTETFEAYHDSSVAGARFTPVQREHFSPPTMTRTWFHQGPVGDEFGEWVELDYSAEFWNGDASVLDHVGGINRYLDSMPPGLSSRRARRDALRALRGSILRSEIYVLDGSTLESRPAEITEHAYGVREESPPASSDHTRQRVFFPFLRAERTTAWERGDDPLTQFTLFDAYNEFGEPCHQTEAAPPRRSERRHAVTGVDIGTVQPDETSLLTIHTVTRFATPAAGVYMHDRVAESSIYELVTPRTVTESAPNIARLVIADQARAALDVHRLFMAEAPGTVRRTGHAVSYYDGDAFVGLPLGFAGRFGALSRAAVLAMTDVELDAALGPGRPAYLDGPAPLPPGLPPGFGADTGYRREVGSGGVRSYYVDVERRKFDFQALPGSPLARGLVVAMRNERGHDTSIEYDAFRLLPTRVVDPLGLETKASHDYRTLQTSTVVDANGNVGEFRYSPSGLLAETWAKGNPARTEGDRTVPSLTSRADFLAFERERQPISIHTSRRVYHDTDASAPPSERNATLESREYSDGFGRVIQVRAQAESVVFGAAGDDVGLPADAGTTTTAATGVTAPDRAIVSAWQVFDNKGRVVKTYDPFFDNGWDFAPNAPHGTPTTTYYDGEGRVIRVVSPNGAEQRTVFGIPRALTDPDLFAPTPWEAYAYDANDLAPLSHGPGGGSLAGTAPPTHHFTPSSSVVDALGRAVCRVERLGPNASTQWQVTRARYDLRDNLLALIDPQGRQSFSAAYDLANSALRVATIDAGVRTTVINAGGTTIDYRDEKGSAVLRTYDATDRPIDTWARDDGTTPLTLREHVEYGDEGNRATNAALNRLGLPSAHYDEAGLTEFLRYDFTGNVLEQRRRAVRANLATDSWVANWNVPNPGALLDPREYRVDVHLDAIERVREMLYPADTAGHRVTLRTRYNRAGALEHVTLDGATYVEHVAYDARGQRALIAYGNGVMARQRHDALTSRLVRAHTQRYTRPTPNTFVPAGGVLQDSGYEHDTVGNVDGIHERAPECGIPGSALGADALDRRFEYDPLYRLTSATGRECDAPPTGSLWAPAPRCADMTRVRRYEESYEYFTAQGLRTLTHTHHKADGTQQSAKRVFACAPGSNRLQSMAIGALVTNYAHDASGNVVQEAGSRFFAWDHAERLRGFRVQAGTGPASVRGRYLYDTDGSRSVKIVRQQGAADDVTVYVEGIFELHRRGSSEHCLLHVMDADRRLAIVRVGAAFPEDGAPDMPVQYQLGDHLDSSRLVIGGATAADHSLIRREEFTPYGETSYGAFARKRYRFAGKERDEESGLYYFGARYYAPWTARWWSCDPAGMTDSLNLYTFSLENPVSLHDDDGSQTRPPPGARVHVFKQSSKKEDPGYSRTVRLPGGKPAPRGAGQAGQGHSTPRSSPGGGGTHGKDATTRAGTKTGIKDGHGAGSGTGKGTNNIGGAGGGAQGSPEGGAGGSTTGGTSGSTTGSPTGSASSRGGSPTGTDDPTLHKKESGEGGTGITGKGTGSLTQLDLAVLIANAVEDPLANALDAATTATPESGKSGGLPEGDSPNSSGNETVQAVYVAVKAVKAVVAAAVAVVGSAAKSGAKTAAAKLGSGRAYSVLAEVKLKRPPRIKFGPQWQRWKRLSHRWGAERELKKMMKDNKVLRDAVKQARANGNWVWHHHPGRIGVMQLVPAEQHSSGFLKNLFHPKQMGKGRGGFWKWGHLY